MAKFSSASPVGFGKRGDTAPRSMPARVRPNLPAAKPCAAIDDPAIQSVLSEFEQCAVILGVILSVMNRPNAREVVHFSMAEYQPARPVQFLALSQIIADNGLPEACIEALEHFYACFDKAAPAIYEITHDMPNGFNQIWMMNAVTELTRAAHAARTAMSLLGISRSAPMSEAKMRRAPAVELVELLDDVIAGGAPCWGGGRPAMPAWQLARITKRRALISEAVLQWGDTSEIVLVENVSRAGLGFSPAPKCKVGESVSVSFDFGRTLMGKLEWKDASRAGLQFTTLLALNDPLISAG